MKIESPPPNLSSHVVRVEQVTMNSKTQELKRDRGDKNAQRLQKKRHLKTGLGEGKRYQSGVYGVQAISAHDRSQEVLG
jgi:hypothetical protein